MKALSIRQPWAWAIIHAGKDIENRTWCTPYRGPVVIHASQGMTLREYFQFRNSVSNAAFPFAEAVLRAGDVPEVGALERGGIIGQAVITNCVSSSSSPWFMGPYGFVLADIKPLPFRPFKGSLGFFDVPEVPR